MSDAATVAMAARLGNNSGLQPLPPRARTVSTAIKRPRLLLLGLLMLLLCAGVVLFGRRVLPGAPVLLALIVPWLLVSGLLLLDRARR